MSDNNSLALKAIVDAVDSSASPMDSFTAMIVFFMSTTKSLDLDRAWVAFSNASTILEGGTPSTYDVSIPGDDLPRSKKKRVVSAGKV